MHTSLVPKQEAALLQWNSLRQGVDRVLLMELEAGTTIARMQPVGRLPRFEEPFRFIAEFRLPCCEDIVKTWHQLCATIFLRIVQQVEYPLDMRTIFGPGSGDLKGNS